MLKLRVLQNVLLTTINNSTLLRIDTLDFMMLSDGERNAFLLCSTIIFSHFPFAKQKLNYLNIKCIKKKFQVHKLCCCCAFSGILC
jgi:hypothetical protein